MARSYFEAFYEVRKLRRVRVYSPTQANREQFAREMTGKLDIEVVAVESPERVVREADIVATCTDSTRTVFDEPEWLKEGAHITCVRACEIGPRVIKRCDLSVKLGKNTIEAMDEGMVGLHGNVGYIAGQPEERARIPNPTVDNYKGDYFKYFMDVRAGKVPGRVNDKQVTFFINAGTQGLQFAACAGKVVELAKQKSWAGSCRRSGFCRIFGIKRRSSVGVQSLGSRRSGFSFSEIHYSNSSQSLETRDQNVEPRIDIVILVSQILDLLFVHAEIVGDLVQHSQANFLAQLFGIGKIFQQGLGKNGDFIGQQRRIEAGTFGQWDALINAIESVVPRIEPLRASSSIRAVLRTTNSTFCSCSRNSAEAGREHGPLLS